ncbi:MAG TPA: hypothetical protein VK590_03200 [Saprospiraceae bacterium]|nr:hypothetical protein [Saprospiraceae bacterium]
MNFNVGDRVYRKNAPHELGRIVEIEQGQWIQAGVFKVPVLWDKYPGTVPSYVSRSSLIKVCEPNDLLKDML